MEHTKPTRSRKPKAASISFEMPVNSRSYAVQVTPFTIPSGEPMYRVSYNNGPVHIFSWDEGLDRFAEKNPTGETLAPAVEMGIAEILEQRIRQMQDAA